jgi:hypothetical protein
MQKIETSGFLFKYNIEPSERILLGTFIEDKYKRISGDSEKVDRTKLVNQIELECTKKGKKGISMSTLRRLTGKVGSNSISHEVMDSLLTFLDIKTFEELDLNIQNYLNPEKADKKPLNILSFLWPHILKVEFSNHASLKLQYLSGDNFQVLESDIDGIEANDRVLIYQLILKQGLNCNIQKPKQHPDYLNFEEKVLVYTDKGELNTLNNNTTVTSISFEERAMDYSMAMGTNKNHLRDILLPLNKKNNPLEKLPSNVDALWYCSAGVDFRSPVFFSNGYLSLVNKLKETNFVAPKLFVYNCLGREVTDLKAKLKSGELVELYSDGSTRIVGQNYCEYALKPDKVKFVINPNHIEYFVLPELDSNAQAFYFEVTVISSQFTETHPVLYFEMENINFFNQVVLGNYFNVKYFCATQEGIAFGGNKRSMVKYIYQDHGAKYFAEKGFKPQLVINSGGTAAEALTFVHKQSKIKVQRNFVEYFTKREHQVGNPMFVDSDITKIEYPVKPFKKLHNE